LSANDLADARLSEVFTGYHAFSLLYRYKNRYKVSTVTIEVEIGRRQAYGGVRRS
jgi:hypothetical protein